MDALPSHPSLIPEVLLPEPPEPDTTLPTPEGSTRRKILSPVELQPFIADFLEGAKALNRPASYQGYKKALERFLGFWQGPGSTHPFGPRLCQAFKVYLEEEKLSANTRQVYLSALRLFGRSLVFRGLMKWNPMEGIRSPKISPLFKKQPLSLEQVETLLETLQEDTLLQLRDKALLYLMLKTGLRGIEVVRADVKDYQTVPDGHILWVQRKGRDAKDKFVVIVPKVKELFDRYLIRRMQESRAAASLGKTWPDGDEPLFLTCGKRQGHRLSTTTLQALIRWWLTVAQVKSPVVTGHSLRHTAATMAIDAGAPLPAVKDMLDHSSLKHTNIYVHTLDRVKRGGESFITQY